MLSAAGSHHDEDHVTLSVDSGTIASCITLLALEVLITCQDQLALCSKLSGVASIAVAAVEGSLSMLLAPQCHNWLCFGRLKTSITSTMLVARAI